MKKITLLFVLAFAITIVKAQFEVGQKIVSGTLGISGNNYKTNDSTSGFAKQNNTNFNIGFSIGKFKTANHATGFGISLMNGYSNSQNFNTNASIKQNNYTIAANYFSTYYHSFGKSFLVWLNWNTGLSYGFSNYNQTSATSSSKSNSFGISSSLNPGISYRINDRFLLNAALNNFLSLSYNHSKNTNSNYPSINNEYKQNNFALNTNMSLTNINIGISYLMK